MSFDKFQHFFYFPVHFLPVLIVIGQGIMYLLECKVWMSADYLYPSGLKGVVVGEGDTYEDALEDVKSAISALF